MYKLKQHPSFYSSMLTSMSDRTPYTYLIGWAELNTYYYGRRTAKGCTPSEFFNLNIKHPYLTTSKKVKEFIVKHGNPDVIQIRGIFSDIVRCGKAEERATKLIYKLDNWLNIQPANAKWDTTGKQPALCAITKTSLGSICVNDPRWLSGEIITHRTGSHPVFSDTHKANLSKSGKGRKMPNCDRSAQKSVAGKLVLSKMRLEHNGMSKWTYITPIGIYTSPTIGALANNLKPVTFVARCIHSKKGFTRILTSDHMQLMHSPVLAATPDELRT